MVLSIVLRALLRHSRPIHSPVNSSENWLESADQMPTEANAYYHLTFALSGTVTADINNPDKGKPGESRGRKAMDLKPCRRHGHDCQAAEDQRLALFLSFDGPGHFQARLL
jgi:hypothetical protein